MSPKAAAADDSSAKAHGNRFNLDRFLTASKRQFWEKILAFESILFWGWDMRILGLGRPTFVALAACTMVVTCVRSANAGIVNGGFETSDFTGWSTLGEASVSTGVNYGAPGTVMPDEGGYAARLISGDVSVSVIAAAMGVSEATFEASNGGINATDGTLLSQSVSAVAGDSFTFRWNFVEQDYLPYDDWAFYGISLNGGPAAVTKFASLATVGPGGGSTVNGWESLTVNIAQTGNYTFHFGIVNALDTALDSDLWIDGISGTGSLAVPEPTSMALFGLGAIGLLVNKARRKVKKGANGCELPSLR